MNKWFWAWRRLKYAEKEELTSFEDVDMAFISDLISVMCVKYIPRGDGKFSRLSNHIEGLQIEVNWCKDNWKGNDEVLTAFLMGVDATLTELDRVAKRIEKGR